MTFLKRIGGMAALGAALLFGLFIPPAQASHIVNLTQQGSNVVATGSGTIDLTDLSFLDTNQNPSLIIPVGEELILGPTSPTPYNYFGFFTEPAGFGSGGVAFASSGGGDVVAIDGQAVYVPVGYVSGSALSDTATWNNQTFASLGATPGPA
ncbi:MAG: hypothetical protein ACREFP_11485 [Acetobacteraceae bacterium]